MTEEMLEVKDSVPKQEKNQIKKPDSILIICTIGILLSVGNITARLYGFWAESTYVWSIFNVFAVGLSVVDLICFIFILKMYKMAVYVYTVFFAIYHVSLIVFGMFSFIGFAIHGVILFLLFKNIRLMK